MRITYSGVTGTLALALAISTGGAYAANTLMPKNSVTTQTIRNGQVHAEDLGQNSVTSRKVRPNALNGTDINELTLGKVPSAGSADQAVSAREADVAARARTADRADTTARADAATVAERARFADEAGTAVVAERATNLLKVVASDDGEVISAASSLGARVNRTDKGVYEVTFGRDLTPCAIATSIQGDSVDEYPFGVESIVPSRANNDPRVATVTLRDVSDKRTNAPFSLIAVC